MYNKVEKEVFSSIFFQIAKRRACEVGGSGSEGGQKFSVLTGLFRPRNGKDMTLDSDSHLVASYLKGDEKSLEILIKRYLKPVFNFIRQFVGSAQDAEDITQDVFIKVWRNLKKYNQNKSFKTWIFIIAKNACVDFLRKKRPVLFSSLENDEGKNSLVANLPDVNPSPLELVKQADVQRDLSLALLKLAPKSRALLVLRYNDHLTFREIAEILDEPLNTVKSRHRRALVLLKKILKK